jgi:deoxyribodipyrimidine photolyase
MITDHRRIQILNGAQEHTGPVVYWMQRDQRVCDNWALTYAQEMAIAMEQPLLVWFRNSCAPQSGNMGLWLQDLPKQHKNWQDLKSLLTCC